MQPLPPFFSCRIDLPLVAWLIVAGGILTAAEPTRNVPRPPPPPVAQRVCDLVLRPAELMRHVDYLASPELKGRSGPEAELAAKYIIRQFADAKLQPLFGQDYIQLISDAPAADGSIPILGRNVGAILPGSDPQLRDEVLLIGVHFDHLGIRRGAIYPGADDNATSVAMMLETARWLSEMPRPPRRSIVFVGFDLEEQLLYGSRWFAAHPPFPMQRIKLMVTADLIGRSLGDLPLPMVFMFGSEYCPHLRQQVAEVGLPDGLELGRLSTDFIGTRSDYGPFRDQRIPFLFFSTGEHPDYHSPRDLPEKIDSAKLTRISSLIAQTILTVADSPAALEWNGQPQPDLANATTMERVTAVMLAEERAGRKPLAPAIRLVAEQTQSKTRYLRERGDISDLEQVWLRRSAQFLLFSAF